MTGRVIGMVDTHECVHGLVMDACPWKSIVLHLTNLCFRFATQLSSPSDLHHALLVRFECGALHTHAENGIKTLSNTKPMAPSLCMLDLDRPSHPQSLHFNFIFTSYPSSLTSLDLVWYLYFYQNIIIRLKKKKVIKLKFCRDIFVRKKNSFASYFWRSQPSYSLNLVESR